MRGKPDSESTDSLEPVASPPPEFPVVQLKPQEDRRVRRGHLWIFSNEVEKAPPGLSPGDPVHFNTAQGAFLGTGFYNPRSLIAGRVLDRHPVALDAVFFENRLRRALEIRRRLYTDSAYRWVFGESDDLPGLVIDRYGEVCVLESTCAGMDRLLPAVTEALQAIQPWQALVLRNDGAARRWEHLPESTALLTGRVSTPHWFSLDGLSVAADLLAGQKTGFFFDQRDNRKTVAALCQSRRVLDLFCHTGGFGIWAAQAGAAWVCGVDNSEPALRLAQLNAEKNGLEKRVRWEKAEIFEWLAGAKEKFDVVVADPPNFAPGKKQLPAAQKAYIRLNVLALKQVSGDGFLATACCSQHVDREQFRRILSRAAYESGRRVRLICWGSQSRDHPVRLSMPETEYLKFALLHVL